MGTTQQDILGWLKNARHEGATHMIVVTDTFDYEDYPVNVMPGISVRTVLSEYEGKSMQRVMEVYAMHLDLDAQIKSSKAWNLEEAPAKKTTPKKGAKAEVLSRTFYVVRAKMVGVDGSVGYRYAQSLPGAAVGYEDVRAMVRPCRYIDQARSLLERTQKQYPQWPWKIVPVTLRYVKRIQAAV